MCEYCHSIKCPATCPNYSPSRFDDCDECGGNIYEDDEFYDFDGWLICSDCIDTYVKKYRRFAEECWHASDNREPWEIR